MVRSHPARTALAIAALAVAVIILLGSSVYYRGKAGFQGNLTPGNFTITGMNPLWHMGAEDAGMWGDVGRAPTETNMATYNPSFRMGPRAMAARQAARRLSASPGGAAPGANAMAYKGGRGPRAMAAGRRETLETPCGPGQSAVTLVGTDGRPVTTCVNSAAPMRGAPIDPEDAATLGPFNPETDCSEWDPDATVEAQALASVGGLSGKPYGEPALRKAIELASDDSAGLTAPALANLARYSAAP